MVLRLNERILNAAGKLSIDPDRIVSVTNLSKVRNYGVFYEYDHGLNECLMIDYREWFGVRHCFVCDNGFVVEYQEDYLYPEFPKHHNIYNIMVLYCAGFTQKDIAKALNTSTSTIGHRMKIIKQILEVSSIDDIDPEDTIKISYRKIQLSDLSDRLQKIIDKYERRKNNGKNEHNN